MCYGMATMTHRTTFALDAGTTTRIKSLSKLWKVSQAEVVRRAVSLAEMPTSKPDPVALLQQLHSSGEGLPAKTAKAYLAEVREDRKHWRGQ
jgi:hypothetical protein